MGQDAFQNASFKDASFGNWNEDSSCLRAMTITEFWSNVFIQSQNGMFGAEFKFISVSSSLNLSMSVLCENCFSCFNVKRWLCYFWNHIKGVFKNYADNFLPYFDQLTCSVDIFTKYAY